MTASPKLNAAIFDLDGVITDTAALHARTWKELIDPILRAHEEETGDPQPPFDPEEDYRRYVDGKPRHQGLQSFLEARGIELPPGEPGDPPDRETICGQANRKNQIFGALLEEEGVKLVPGTVELVRVLQEHGIRTAVASSSRNCRRILERAGLSDLFEVRVDGETLGELGMSGKPDPDMFLEAARRIETEPSDCVVFEDAVSGVVAGKRGGFGLVVGVAMDDSARISLREAGADLMVDAGRMSASTLETLEGWFTRARHRRPHALTSWDELAGKFRARHPVIFLDYDGTLTPIVARPDEAILSDPMREVVRRLAERFPTTIVSGRGRSDVEKLVRLENLNYAGSHGFDISGPDAREGRPIRHEAAAEMEPIVEEVTARLREQLDGIQGALVEPKRFTVAVHYRLVDPDEVYLVESVVDDALQEHSELKKAHGKKVFELRPRMDWDKGKAVVWLLDALELHDRDTLPLYLGDDTTDEDAFQALQNRGLGIVVTLVPRPTAASYQLQDTREVQEFLSRLAEL